MSFEERRRQRAGRGGNLAHYSARLLGSDIAARRVCPSSGPSVHGAAGDGCRTREESVGLGGSPSDSNELEKKMGYDIYCPLDNSFIIFASIYSCHLSNILSNIQLARRQTPVREGQAGERCMYGSLNWLYRIICDRVFAHRRSVETQDFLTGNS